MLGVVKHWINWKTGTARSYEVCPMKSGKEGHEELGFIQMWQMPVIPALRWLAQEGP